MPLANLDLYDALIAAGAPEAKARKAAETTSDLNRLAKLEAAAAATEARLTMLVWFVGIHFALTVAGFGLTITQLLAIAAKLP